MSGARVTTDEMAAGRKANFSPKETTLPIAADHSHGQVGRGAQCKHHKADFRRDSPRARSVRKAASDVVFRQSVWLCSYDEKLQRHLVLVRVFERVGQREFDRSHPESHRPGNRCDV